MNPSHTRMPNPIPSAAIAACLILASCIPPEPVPPPRFKPNPPYPPQPVDPNGQTTDPYGQNPDGAPPTLPPATPANPGDYPVARPSGKPNEVISPYEPYEPIDITGFSSGQLARDPRNRKIFRIP